MATCALTYDDNTNNLTSYLLESTSGNTTFSATYVLDSNFDDIMRVRDEDQMRLNELLAQELDDVNEWRRRKAQLDCEYKH